MNEMLPAEVDQLRANIRAHDDTVTLAETIQQVLRERGIPVTDSAALAVVSKMRAEGWHR